MRTDTFAVIGGDFRSTVVMNQLADKGYHVKYFGFDETLAMNPNAIHEKNISGALSGAKYVILPLPYASQDSTTINAPLYRKEILISDVIENLPPHCFILGGMLDEVICSTLKSKEITYADYFHREEFTIKNAIPTAEGAIEIALRETPHTLHRSHCLIAGYGRIAKLLSEYLSGFGADITVSARKHSDLAWIEARGHHAIHTSQIKDYIHNFDVIFNTVPYKIFDRTALSLAKKDCLIIDLASKPGGIDFESAQKFGLNVIWALSLPGKVIS